MYFVEVYFNYTLSIPQLYFRSIFQVYLTKRIMAPFRLLSKHFCVQPFFPKDSVSLVFASVAPWGGPMVDTEGKMFEI